MDNNEMNSQGFPNSNASYPISSSASSNPTSKTPPQGFSSHQFSESQGQLIMQQSMPPMHYNNHYQMSVRHAINPNNMNPENCHYGFQGMPHSGMAQLQGGNSIHPGELMHVMGPGGVPVSYHHFNSGGGGGVVGGGGGGQMSYLAMQAAGQVPPMDPQQQQQQMTALLTICLLCQKELLLPPPPGSMIRPHPHHHHHQPIQCTYSCGNWYHRACTGLSQEAYQMLRANEPAVEWICKNCENQFSPRIWYIKPSSHAQQQHHQQRQMQIQQIGPPHHPPPPGYIVNKFVA